MNTKLIPVFSGSISNESTLLVNARDLHEFLGVRRDFSNWIKKRITEYGFLIDTDYVTVENLTSPNLARSKSRARKVIDYHLILDTAKELAMAERNENGRRIRRYFIECEKRLLQKTTKPNISIPRRFLVSIHPDGRQETKVVSDDAYVLSAEEFLRLIIARGIIIDEDLMVGFSLDMLRRIWGDHQKMHK